MNSLCHILSDLLPGQGVYIFYKLAILSHCFLETCVILSRAQNCLGMSLGHYFQCHKAFGFLGVLVSGFALVFRHQALLLLKIGPLLGKDFLDTTPNAWSKKEKNDELDFHQSSKHLHFKRYY